MKPHYTALALVVDRSGSMMSMKDDAEGAVQFILDEQRNEPGRCDVMMCDFSTEWHLLYSLRPVQTTPPFILMPGGGTALLDAIGKTINELGLQLSAMPEDDRPTKVIVAIQTDGQENSSQEFTLEQVQAMIAHQQEVYSWEFLFLGADMDAVSVGTGMGFARGQTYSYTSDHEGTYSMAAAVSSYVSNTRSGKPASLGEDPDDPYYEP